MNQRYINVRIFNDTMQQIDKNKLLLDSVEHSIANQQYYIGEYTVDYDSSTRFDTKVSVTKSSSFDAARKYGKNTCVLNFASASNPGGGVIHGASAQEECLCRCSTLYRCLNADKAHELFYQPHRENLGPLHNDDIIYTPDVYILKSDMYNNLFRPSVVNVITCSAPNLRNIPSNQYNRENGIKPSISDDDLLKLHTERAIKILSVAARNGNENIILGAFGCGAFRNDPEIVARAYADAIGKFNGIFRNIEFAVYCRPGDSTNFDVFKKVIG